MTKKNFDQNTVAFYAAGRIFEMGNADHDDVPEMRSHGAQLSQRPVYQGPDVSVSPGM